MKCTAQQKFVIGKVVVEKDSIINLTPSQMNIFPAKKSTKAELEAAEKSTKTKEA